MALGVESAIAQLDDLLERYSKLPKSHNGDRFDPALGIRMQAALDRLSPAGTSYRTQWLRTRGLEGVVKAVQALRDDYASGYMETISELVHGELFSDMLLAAEHLREEGYKDPAAVMVGGVLEQHLRELCTKNGIPTDDATGKPKKASQLNQDLKAQNIYGKQEHQDVIGWLHLRNEAAHGHYDKYTSEQVKIMSQAVRHFISRFPA